MQKSSLMILGKIIAEYVEKLCAFLQHQFNLDRLNVCRCFNLKTRNVLPFEQVGIVNHYHLEVQANPKKIVQKNWSYFYHVWDKRDYPMTFFFLNSHLGLSRSMRSNDDRFWILRLGSKFNNDPHSTSTRKAQVRI